MSFNTAPIQILPVAAAVTSNVLVQLNSQGQVTPCVGLSTDAPIGVTFLPSTSNNTVAVVGLGAGVLTIKTTGVITTGTAVYSGVNGTVTATAGSYAIGRAVSVQTAGTIDVMPLLTIGGSANAASGGSSTLVTATGSNTPRTLGDRFAEVMDVYDFGAIGDGASHPISASTAIAYNALFPPLACVAGDYNDWCVLQGVMYLAAVNGKAIYTPKGAYLCNHPLNLTSTPTPTAPLPAIPRVTKWYGDGYSSQIIGIVGAGRAVIELLGSDNGNAINMSLSDLRISMDPTSDVGGYALRVGDAWSGIKGYRLRCEGANGLLLKVASSVSYAMLNAEFDQCSFISNYNNAWFANDNNAYLYSLNYETGGSYWDNVQFTSCFFRGLAYPRAFILEFMNCQFQTNQNRPVFGGIDFSGNIYVSLGASSFLGCYFEDHKIAIAAAPITADIQGIEIRDCHFSGVNNYAGPPPLRAISLSTGANGDLGAVVIEGNKIYDVGYSAEPISLFGATATVTDNYNSTGNGTTTSRAAIRTLYQFCNVTERMRVVSNTGNIVGTSKSTYPVDEFLKLQVDDTTATSINTAGGGTAAVQWGAPTIVSTRRGTGIGNGELWALAVQNSGNNDLLEMGWTSTTYTTGGTIAWLANDIPFVYVPLGKKLRVSSGTVATTYAEFDASGITGTGQTFAAQQIQAQVQGIGTVNAASWGYSVQNSGNTDNLSLKWSSTTYTTGGTVPWVINDSAYLYVPSGKTLRIGFGTGNFTEISNTTLYAGTSTGTFLALVVNSQQLVSDGLDTLKTGVEFLNLAGTAAFNWQLSLSGHAYMWTYNGTAWQDSLRVQRTGECLLGSITVPPDTFTGNVNWGARSGRAANAGEVGEVIVATAASTAVAGTGTVGNVASITLTPGSWTITGSYTVNQGATGLTTGTAVNCSIVTTSATDGTQGTTMNQDSALLAVNGFKSMTAPVVTVDISANTTYYLTERVTFGGGSPTVSGTIKGIRRR